MSSRTLSLCLQALSSFRADIDGVEDHINKFLKSELCHGLNETEKVFISEIFAGYIQYKPLIKVVVDGYYLSNEGSSSLHVDSSLYSVFCYLLMFRLEELGMDSFKRLINSQNTHKMYKFLSFFLCKDNLNGWILNEWLKIYDKNFIQIKILHSLQKFESQLRDYIKYLEAKSSNKLTTTRHIKPVTKTKPFDITKPKPRAIPTPEKIPTVQAYKPVPQTTYITPTELQVITQLRDSQKIRSKEKLEESNMKQFSCANTEKSIKTKYVIKQIIEEKESKLDYTPIKPQPVPQSMKESHTLKLNTTAILREAARIQKVEEEEEKRLANLEAGQRDSSEFLKWQEEMKQKEIAEEISERKRRHLIGQLSYEEAIISKQNSIQETKDKVSQMKEESKQMMSEYFKRRENEKKEMRELVEQTMQGHQNTQEAKVKLQKMKQKIVQQIEKEKQEMFKRVLEEEEIEMRRKIELIQEIKAMESVPVTRTKYIDFTETAGQGFLSEMSITELREHLVLMKIAESEEQERKRREIAAVKESKEQLLNETLSAITKYKSAQSIQVKMNQEKQKQNLQKHIASSDKELNELQKKLEMKKKEREKLKQTTFDTLTQHKTNILQSHISESPMDTLLRFLSYYIRATTKLK